MPLPPHDPTPPSARRVPPEPKPPPRIVLDLSLRDATVLVAILQYVSGAPGGPRGSADRINDALWAAKVTTPQGLIASASGVVRLVNDWPTD